MFWLFTTAAVFHRVHVICSFAVAVKLASLPESAARVQCPWAVNAARAAESDIAAAASGSWASSSWAAAARMSPLQISWNMSRPGDPRPRQLIWADLGW